MFIIDNLRFALSIVRIALIGVGILLLLVTGVGLVLVVLLGRRAFELFHEGGCPFRHGTPSQTEPEV
ncbi:MAG TPA: hypothetical protein PLI31_02530 [Methanoregulaceae archaeon]|nr:hypothetical protein [Methanoregulaceae archaeon]